MSRFIGRRIRTWLGLAIVAVAVVVFFAVLMSGMLDKSMKAIVVVVFALATLGSVVAAVVNAGGLPRPGAGVKAFLEPPVLSRLLMAILSGLAVAGSFAPMFDPRAVTTEDLKQTEDRIIAAQKPALPPPLPILSGINGVWGEPGCAVTYRFELRDDWLTVVGVKLPPGAKSEPKSFTVVPDQKRQTLVGTVQEPLAERGRADLFSYFTDGKHERLTWKPQKDPVGLELDRC